MHLAFMLLVMKLENAVAISVSSNAMHEKLIKAAFDC